MTVVDLHNIGKNNVDRWWAIEWLFANYGPADGDTWELEELTRVRFVNDKDATLFILRFS